MMRCKNCFAITRSANVGRPFVCSECFSIWENQNIREYNEFKEFVRAHIGHDELVLYGVGNWAQWENFFEHVEGQENYLEYIIKATDKSQLEHAQLRKYWFVFIRWKFGKCFEKIKLYRLLTSQRKNAIQNEIILLKEILGEDDEEMPA